MSSELVTVKDKLDNKFAITVSKQKLAEFRKACEQRVISLGSCRFPRAFSPDFGDDDALGLTFAYYVRHDLYNQSIDVLEVEKPDHEDYKKKGIRVLRLKYPISKHDLLITADIGRDTYRGYLYLTQDDLRGLLKALPEKPLLNLTHRKVSTGDEEYEGEWVTRVEAIKAEKRVLTLSLTVKARSDAAETVCTLAVTVPEAPEEEDDLPEALKFGDAVFTQGASGSGPLPKDPTSYTLPPAEAKGDVLQDTVLLPTEHSVSVEGNAEMAVRPEKVMVNQSIGSEEFINFFFPVVEVVNKTQTVRSIRRNPKAWYKADGGWREFEATALGVQVDGYYGKEEYWLDANLDLEEGSSVMCVVKCNLTIKGRCGDDNMSRARAHRSLPQPMTIKVELVEEHSNAVHTAILQQANPAVSYPSRATAAKSWANDEAKVKAFVFADDVAAGQRHYAAIYEASEGMILRHSGGNYYTFTLQDFHQLAYQAAKKKAAEFELDYFTKKEGTAEFKASALVDLSVPMVYGMKISVTTDAGAAASDAAHVFVV